MLAAGTMLGPYKFLVGLVGLALLQPRPAAAAWPTDPLLNLPLCTASGNQWYPTSVSDGAGGVIVAWEDWRGSEGRVYAQRISAGATIRWPADGMPICTAAGEEHDPAVVSDGGGGAILTWVDYRSGSGDLYAQRISPAGAVLWTSEGVALCTAPGGLAYPNIIADGTGGAIISWRDFRDGRIAIYAQRISAAGAVQWPADGVALCTISPLLSDLYDTMIADGAGGAIVVWHDNRAGDIDLYAQRISAAGTAEWTPGGMAICTASYDQRRPTLASDGEGGAIVTWMDGRSDDWPDIFAQRISAAGAIAWAPDGVALCTAIYDQQEPAIAPDGTGGAIVAWSDSRGGDADVYAQRISGTGTPQWTADGVALSSNHDDQYPPIVIADGAGGAIVTWCAGLVGARDVYAQRVSTGGTVLWTTSGVPLCTAAWEQYELTMAPDGAGGAIVAWVDYRNEPGCDIYAQRVQATGQLGGDDDVDVPIADPPALALEPVCPNPGRGGALTAHFVLPSGIAATLELVDVAGRRISGCGVGALGVGRHTIDFGKGRRLAPGLYLLRLRQQGHVRVSRVVMLQ